jgi:hypothetical protein
VETGLSESALGFDLEHLNRKIAMEPRSTKLKRVWLRIALQRNARAGVSAVVLP